MLDERQDVHLLVTQSLKNDLMHSNQYIAGLALCTLGSILSAEMSRDLAVDVEKLIKTSNPYLKKKAILCAIRIIRKVPELMEIYIPSVRNLLNEKNHGILMGAIGLITEMCTKSPDILAHFRKLVPNLVRILKNLILSGYSPDHDVSGISDPFLQVRLIRLLRVLGKNDAEASEAMNDILAQVCTNTETTKNAGNSILHETVLTIMDIKSEPALRVLAVNILGRFLVNTDKNIRYVALNTLLKVVHADLGSIQRHRATIVECLKDPDVSLKRRAMELCFALINKQNIVEMTDELMQFLATCEPEFKADCSSNMFIAMDKCAPSRKWHIDQMTRVLKTACNNVRDDIVSNFIMLISNTPDLQYYTMNQLVSLIREDITQQPLVQVAVWCLGEYADLYKSNSDAHVSEQEIITILIRVLNYNAGQVTTRQYAINALIKLSTRFPHMTDQIQSIMSIYGCNMNLELQQRAVEYYAIIRNHEQLRDGLFEQMPALEMKTSSTYSNGVSLDDTTQEPLSEEEKRQQHLLQQQEAAKTLIDIFKDDSPEPPAAAAAPALAPTSPANTNNNDIFDLLSDTPSVANTTPANAAPQSTSNDLEDIFVAPSTKPKSKENILELFNTNTVGKPTVAPQVQQHTNGLDDLLGLSTPISNSSTTKPIANNSNDLLDIFGSGGGSASKPGVTTTTSQKAPNSLVNDLFDFGGLPETKAASAAVEHSVSSSSSLNIVGYEKNDLKITFDRAKASSGDQHFVQMNASNLSMSSAIREFLFGVAVPKSMQMQLSQPTTSVIDPLDSMTQVITIKNPNKVR